MGHVNPKVVGVSGAFPVDETKILTAETNIVTFDNLAGNAATLIRIDGFFEVGTFVGAMIPVLTINNDKSGTDTIDGKYQEFIADLDDPYNPVAKSNQIEFGFVSDNILIGDLVMFNIEIYAKGGATSGHVIKSEVHNSQSTTGKTKLITGSYDVPDEINSIELRMLDAVPLSTYAIGSTFQLSYMG